MSIKCLINGLEVNYPCSPVCALFGDCVTAFEAQKKENVRTNADRIRAMSDEALAKMFMDFSEKLLNECGVVAEAKTTEYVLEWLKHPVEK